MLPNDCLQIVRHRWGEVGLALSQLRVEDNGGEQVAEIVGDADNQLFLAAQLCLQRLLFGNVGGEFETRLAAIRPRDDAVNLK